MTGQGRTDDSEAGDGQQRDEHSETPNTWLLSIHRRYSVMERDRRRSKSMGLSEENLEQIRNPVR